MHRSGTSALTRVASMAGASLPATLMDSSRSNATGFWESVALMKFHDDLLAEIGSCWRDWRAVEIGRLPLNRRKELKAELVGLVAEEYGDAPLFVIKDPRICRFASFYLEALEEAAIDVRPIIPFRNPIEVTDSLSSKYGTVAPSEGGLLWLRHVLEAETATRSRRRAVVSYGSLLTDWRTCFKRLTDQTGAVWPYDVEDIADEVTRFLNGPHRHHARSTEDLLLHPVLRHWIGEAYSALLVLERNPGSAAALAALDRVRTEFSRSSPILYQLIEDTRAEAERKLADSLCAADAKTAERLQMLADREAKAEDVKRALGAAEERSAELRQSLDQRDAEAKELKAALGAADAQAGEQTRALAQRDAELKDLQSALSVATVMANDLTQMLGRRETETDDLKATIAVADAEATELAQALGRRTAEVEERDRKISELEMRTSELGQALAARQAEIEGLRPRLGAAEREISRLMTSASWRLTVPLRAVGRRALRLPQPLQRAGHFAWWTVSLQLRSRLRVSKRLRREPALIGGSGLFDRELYLAQNPDVAEKGADPVLHYLRYGATEGRNPGPAFNTRWYLAQYPDVAKAGMNPLVHFIDYGRAEERCPLPPEPPKQEPARHEVDRADAPIPQSEQPKPEGHPLTGTEQIAKDAGQSPTHREPAIAPDQQAAMIANSGLFDRDWYLARYRDVAADGIDPAIHYVLDGAAEGRDPGPNFSTRAYLSAHHDAAKIGLNPLVHYILHGGKPSETGAQPEPQEAPSAPAFEPPVDAVRPVSLPFPAAAELAWVRHRDLARTSDSIALELLGILLGTTPLSTIDSDDPWRSFALPARSLSAFCRMMGIDVCRELRCYRGDSPCRAALELDSRAKGCPVLFLGDADVHIAIADVWFTTDFDLRLRLDAHWGAGVPPVTVRLYQYDLSNEPRLLMVGEAPISGPGVDFMDARLVNPFLPLLIAVSAPAGRLISASLLPFPSLCRGGVHYAELCALGTGASYFESLREVSGTLLAELLGDGEPKTGYSVARLKIDLQGATGAERIFSALIREWLGAVMAVEPAPANASAVPDTKMRSYLAEALGPLPRASGAEISRRIETRNTEGVLELTLPADAVPSLHGLVARQLALPSGQPCAVGSFLVAEWATASPEWAVKVPPLGEELLALQPAGTPVGYPSATRILPDRGESKTRDLASIPLAVRFCDPRSRSEAKLLMPLAADKPAPLLRRPLRHAAAGTLGISVLLPACHPDSGAFAAFLESLALQSVADQLEIILDAPSADGLQVLGPLKEFFAGRYLVLDSQVGTNRQRWINLAARRSEGRFLLVAGEGLVLHDPRTLETLRLLADNDKVGSTGCMLVGHTQSKNGYQVVFRSSGLFPAETSRSGAFRELDCHGALPLATYPVAANSPSLFMVRADVWRSLGGLDASITPDSHAHVRYSLKAISEGFVHFCTSAVSAGFIGDAHDGTVDGEVVWPEDAAGRCPDIASSTVILEALRG